jgi:hypothetical protein
MRVRSASIAIFFGLPFCAAAAGAALVFARAAFQPNAVSTMAAQLPSICDILVLLNIEMFTLGIEWL